jgi:hypothetical protein
MIVLAGCVLTVAGAQAQPSDVLVDVNALAFRVHDAVSQAPMPARNMAIVNLAMFDAVNAIEQRYAALSRPGRGANRRVAGRPRPWEPAARQ